MISNYPFSLAGKIFLITGASSGIGFEICKAIDLLNGRFIAVARREDNLKKLLSECSGTGHQYIAADLSIEADLDNVIGSFDKIDGIVHSAGFFKYQFIKFYKLDVFREMRAINVDSIVYLLNSICKKKKLNKDASVVLISSLSAINGNIGGAYYCSTKAELMALSKVWSYELAASGTRVNCVSPATVETEMVLNAFVSISDEEVQLDKSKYPLGYGRAIDIAYPIAFLLSEASNGINGQNIVLDGGRTCNPVP